MRALKQTKPIYPKKIECKLCGKSITNYNYEQHFQKQHNMSKDEYFKQFHPTLFKFTITVFGRTIDKKIFINKLKQWKQPRYNNLSFNEVKFLLFLYTHPAYHIGGSTAHKRIINVFDYWMKIEKYTFKEICSRWDKLINYPHTPADNQDYLVLLYGDTEGNKRFKEKQKRIEGKNNPGYNHGGKFSPFSKKFIKYEDTQNSEEKIKEV